MTTDPMDGGYPMESTSQTCRGTNKQGNRCGRRPIPGGTVCKLHGGGAPQVQRKAAMRLLNLIDPAIGLLAREMTTAEKSSDRQRAANSILDRAGVPRSTTSPDQEVSKEMLKERLQEIRDARDAEAASQKTNTIQGEILSDE